MATRTNRVEVEITATDEATPKIERLERKIDGLESDEARIIVTAQTERLEEQLDAARRKLDGLEGDEATVQARLVGNLEAELDQAQTLFNQLDGKTGTVRLNAVDTASGDIDRVDQKRRDLDGKTATVRIDATGAGDIAAGVAGGIGAANLADQFFQGAQEANSMALEVDELAGLTGATLEDASALAGIWRAQGLDVADLADVLLQVNQTLRDNPELAEQLGVKIGQNTTLIETFVQAVDGVSTSYDNASDRSVAASQLFGEEGVRQVNRITRAIDTDLQEAVDGFTGPIITDESVENARQINTELQKAKQQVQEIQLALLPVVNKILESAIGFYTGAFNLGNTVANAGGDARRTIESFFSGGSTDQAGLGEQAVAFRNTSGFTGGALAGYDDRGRPIPNVTVINPPGTPTTVVNADRIYQRRNGDTRQ